MKVTTSNTEEISNQEHMNDKSIQSLYELREKLSNELAAVNRTIALLEAKGTQRQESNA
jgi:hypothetical protein